MMMVSALDMYVAAPIHRVALIFVLLHHHRRVCVGE